MKTNKIYLTIFGLCVFISQIHAQGWPFLGTAESVAHTSTKKNFH